MDKLLLFDGNSIVNRAFYGIRNLTNSEGVPTNALLGFINIYNKLVAQVCPDAICVAFDLRAPTFRHKMYDGYKASRHGMPEELAQQMPLLKEWLDLAGIARLELEGFEADDIIGTLAALCDSEDCECFIATGDRDDLALCTEKVSVMLALTKGGASETRLYTPQTVLEEYGFEPSKITDYKAICGDSSDCIPGVAGIGDKGAKALIAEFGGLSEIYDSLDKMKKSVADKLIASREMAQLSFSLATISREVPLDIALADLAPRECNSAALAEFYTKYEFQALLAKLALPQSAKCAATLPRICELTNEMELLQLSEGPFFVAFSENTLAIFEGERLYTLSDSALIKAFCEGGAKKVVHDEKALKTALAKEGITLCGVVFDVFLAAYIANPSEKSYSPLTLAENYLGQTIGEGAADEAFALSPLTKLFSEKLKEEGGDKLYYEIELPLAQVLFEMEQAGFLVDAKKLEAFGELLKTRIAELETSVFEAAGTTFNLGSPKQLAEVLFEKMGLPPQKKTKTGYSTGAEVLEKLKKYSPVVPDIIEHRTLSKLKNTYADGLLKVISKADGRIHTTFTQTVTQTGRVSSTEPNLQNIPVRGEVGREIRRLFIPREGCLLLDADYSQIELRVLAHISGDSAMIDAFLKGEDIHAVTASQVFGVPLCEVTGEQRRRAKAVNFGIVYGISDFSLAQDIGVSRAEAKEYIEGYFAHYPKIKEYLERTVLQAKSDGFVTTIFGRRRYIPELSSKNFNLRSFGERVAMNTPIQGAAADIIKIAMVRVAAALKAEKLDSRLILQVHDELIIEAPFAEKEAAAALLKREMEAAVSLAAPLLAEVGIGDTWLDAKA